MNLAAEFLVALARSASNLSLYPARHPVREQSLEQSFQRLVRLLDETPTARFTFLEELTVLGRRPVRPLVNWDWGKRLFDLGIQWLEVEKGVTREELDGFLDEIVRRQAGRASDTVDMAEPGEHIRYGALGLRTGERGPAKGRRSVVAYSLREEVEAVDWIHAEVRRGGAPHRVEAETVVHSLAVAMRGDGDQLIPLLRLPSHEAYARTHALNVAVLAMSLGEHVGLPPDEVHAMGMAGLLHDLGMIFLADEVLAKDGALTEAEWKQVRAHTLAGARRLLESADDMGLPAVVAYEHHMRPNGEGYPSPSRSRRPHPASELVRVCDVFDALWTARPYRESWEVERILQYLERGAGRDFDADLAQAFTRMIRARRGRILEVSDPGEPLLVTGLGPD